jgi:choline/glycine/proline betaine transport protein
VLLVPVLFTFLWMTVFGNTAIWQQTIGAVPLIDIVRDNLPVALFASLEGLPLATLTSAVATLLVVTFFVTSADSGALVIDIITSGSTTGSPVWQRIFWAVAAGTIAAVLLVSGGLNALQTAAIASALPFAVFMIFICYGVLRALQLEGTSRAGSALIEVSSDHANWQQRLKALLRSHGRSDIEAFVRDVARPALEEVAQQIRESGHEATLLSAADRLDLIVGKAGADSFQYSVRVKGFRAPTFALAERPLDVEAERSYHVLVESSQDRTSADVTGFTREQIINDFVSRYARSRAIGRRG